MKALSRAIAPKDFDAPFAEDTSDTLAGTCYKRMVRESAESPWVGTKASGGSDAPVPFPGSRRRAVSSPRIFGIITRWGSFQSLANPLY
jgi:hypothetical protein